jgi:hypothetical protein
MVREKLAAAQRPDAYEGRYAGYRGAISNGKPRDICVLQPSSRAGEFLFFFDNFAANQTKGFRRMQVGSIRRPVESGTDQRLLHRL